MFVENNQDKRIVNFALETLQENAGLKINIKDDKNNPKNNQLCDGILYIKINRKKITYCFEYKKYINKPIIGLMIQKQNNLKQNFLVITKYVSSYLAEQLKNNNIQFIDTVGNVYINIDPIYIFIKGNEKPKITKNKESNSLFKSSGIKTIFILLADSLSINRTYRNIAVEADVSLGTVSQVIGDLTRLGFIVNIANNKRRLIHKEELLKKWCVAYSDILKPKLFIGRYRGSPNWWDGKNLNSKEGKWGGEIGAQLLTKYLKPEIITIYAAKGKYEDILIDNKLRSDYNGNVELIEKFWRNENIDKEYNTVHPILIYADLIGTADYRNIKTAEVLYEKYIDRFIR